MRGEKRDVFGKTFRSLGMTKNYGDERKEGEHREAGMEVDCKRKSGAAVG